MVITRENQARNAWNANPHLAYSFADFQAFRQAFDIRYRELDAGAERSQQSVTAWVHSELSTALDRLNVARNPGEDGKTPGIERRGNRITLWLYGAVGSGNLSASNIGDFLQANQDAQTIVLRIASGGGFADDARTIAGHLIGHPARVLAIVDTCCYSAATIVAASADRVLIRRSATWMAHQSEVTQSGNADALTRRAGELRIHDNRIAMQLARRNRLTVGGAHRLLAAGDFLSAKQAVDARVADRVISDLPTWSTQ